MAHCTPHWANEYVTKLPELFTVVYCLTSFPIAEIAHKTPPVWLETSLIENLICMYVCVVVGAKSLEYYSSSD